MTRTPWHRPCWGATDVVAAALGLIGLLLVAAGGGLLGGIIAFAGMWLEFTRLYEVRWLGFGHSDDDDDEDLIHF